MHDASRRLPMGCPEFRSLAQLGRRQVVQAGAAGLLGLSLPGLMAARAHAADEPAAGSGISGFGKAKTLHLPVHVGRAEPARHVRPEARRSGQHSRAVQADRDEDAGPRDLRTLREARRLDGQAGGHSLAQSRRSGSSVERSCDGHRASGPGRAKRQRPTQSERHAAPGFGAREAAAAANRAAAVRHAALDCVSSGRARRTSTRSAWRLARPGLRSAAGHRRSRTTRTGKCRRSICCRESRPICSPTVTCSCRSSTASGRRSTRSLPRRQ